MRNQTVSTEPNRAERRAAASIKERPPVERRAYQILEFCEAYRISRSALYLMIRSGKIKSSLLGGRRVIPVEEGQRLLEQGAR
jgi:hypothetical protein